MRTPAALVALSLIAATTVVAAAPAEASTPKCFGKKATITVTKKNKTVKGTKKNDVIIVTSSGDTIVGNGGDDRICAKKVKSVTTGSGKDQIQLTDGRVSSGAGNDTIVQKGAGKVSISAGAGSDTVTISNQIKPGSILDGGPDPDSFTVPAAQVPNLSIPVTSGDRLNGINLGVDQPATGGPAFNIAFDYEQASAEPGQAQVPVTGGSWLDPYTEGADYVDVSTPAYAVGRAPGAWSIDFGDATPPLTGTGEPPEAPHHSYLVAKAYTVTVRVSDDLGQATTHTLPIVATPSLRFPEDSLGAPTISGLTATIPVVVPFSGPTVDAITSWVATYGDGSEASGNGPLPATLPPHTYAFASGYTARLLYETAHERSSGSSVPVNFSSPMPHLQLDLYNNFQRIGQAAHHSYAGADVTIVARDSYGFDSYTINPGTSSAPLDTDGQSVEYADPGTYTITLVGHRSGQPDVSATTTLQVVAIPSHIELHAPSFAVEGPVTWDLAGTVVAPGAHWSYSLSTDVGYHSGTGPVPTSVTATVPASLQQSMGFSQPDLFAFIESAQEPLTDTTDVEYSTYASAPVNVVPLGTRVGSVQQDRRVDTTTAGASNVVDLSVQPLAPTGAKIASVAFSSDGVPLPVNPDNDLPSSSVVHAFPVGVHQVLVTAKDSLGRSAVSQATVSVVAPLALTVPTADTATHGVVKSFTGWSAAVPAGDAAVAWQVAWGDGSYDRGYGPLPPSIAHTYAAAGTDEVDVQIYDDHGQISDHSYSVTVG